MKSRMLGLALLLAVPLCASAQSADPATRELIEKLLARIDSLEKRVVQLEQGNPAIAARTPAPAATTSPAAAQAHAHDQAPVPSTTMAAEAAQPTYPLLKRSEERRV